MDQQPKESGIIGRKKVDEDWKRRAVEEKHRLQPAAAGGTGAGGGAPSAGGKDAGKGAPQHPTSPAFMEFLSELATQALIHLGEMPHPATGRRQPNLDQAQYTLEVLQAIQKKTEGNLSAEEKRLMDGVLYELRMKYVRAAGPSPMDGGAGAVPLSPDR